MNEPRDREATRSPVKVTTKDEAEALLIALSEFYGERVAPASHHCSALLEWMRIMDSSGYAPEVGKAWGSIALTLTKSNLAARLVYGGERVRTEKCPVHQGRWSGCTWGDNVCEEGCMYGSNVTGWLQSRHEYEPWPDDENAARAREFFKYDPTTRCRHCDGQASGLVHQALDTATLSSPASPVSDSARSGGRE